MKLLSRVYRNKKGFSLVELIIVVAIMVALVAVLAPGYIKYVDRARDAVVTDAAESVAEFCRTEFANGTFRGSGEIRVGKGSDGKLEIKFLESTNPNKVLIYEDKSGTEAETLFVKACGYDSSKKVRSNLAYIVSIDGTVISHPTIIIDEE